jgi:hypothetical protein
MEWEAFKYCQMRLVLLNDKKHHENMRCANDKEKNSRQHLPSNGAISCLSAAMFTLDLGDFTCRVEPRTLRQGTPNDTRIVKFVADDVDCGYIIILKNK